MKKFHRQLRRKTNNTTQISAGSVEQYENSQDKSNK